MLLALSCPSQLKKYLRKFRSSDLKSYGPAGFDLLSAEYDINIQLYDRRRTRRVDSANPQWIPTRVVSCTIFPGTISTPCFLVSVLGIQSLSGDVAAASATETVIHLGITCEPQSGSLEEDLPRVGTENETFFISHLIRQSRTIDSPFYGGINLSSRFICSQR